MDNNILSYVRTNLKTFEEFPFTDVDALVLSWLSYIYYPKAEKKVFTYEGIKFTDLLKAEYFDEMFSYSVEREKNKDLLIAVGVSKRYRNIRICNYIDKLDPSKKQQFAAVTFVIDHNFVFCGFRGTDSTIVGWKENFDLNSTEAIPSQKLAYRYVKDVANNLPGKIITGGHSKGGNLAVYGAAMNINTLENRIEKIYSFDGPGFKQNLLNTDDFIKAQDKIRKIIPVRSVISTIFKPEADISVIYSDGKGMLQHDPFTWEVIDLHFSYLTEVSTRSKYYYKIINDSLEKLTDEEYVKFTDLVFEVIDKTGSTSLSELTSNIKKNLPKFTNILLSISEEDRKFFFENVLKILEISLTSIPDIILEKVK